MSKQIKESLVSWIKDNMADLFSEVCVVDLVDDYKNSLGSLMHEGEPFYKLWYGLEETTQFGVLVTPLILQTSDEPGASSKNEDKVGYNYDQTCKIDLMCPLFRLLYSCEYFCENSLAEIEGLLSCAIVVRNDQVKDTLLQSHTLLYTLGWLHELLNGFSIVVDNDKHAYLGKLIKRIGTCSELEQALNDSIEFLAGYRPLQPIQGKEKLNFTEAIQMCRALSFNSLKLIKYCKEAKEYNYLLNELHRRVTKKDCDVSEYRDFIPWLLSGISIKDVLVELIIDIFYVICSNDYFILNYKDILFLLDFKATFESYLSSEEYTLNIGIYDDNLLSRH
jgi:hypothetical protein